MKKFNILIYAGIIIILSVLFATYFNFINKEGVKTPAHSLSDENIQKNLGKELNDAIFILDKYFEKYNEKNFPYICKKLVTEDFYKEQSLKECSLNIKTSYDIYGKEEKYNLDDAYILKNSDKNFTEYYLEIPIIFQNYDNVLFKIRLKKIKNDVFKIRYIAIIVK